MTIPSVFKELVETWISEHPGKGCTKKTGKRELVAKFRSHYGPEVPEETITKQIKHLLAQQRPSVQPQKTNPGLSPPNVGGPTAHAPSEKKKTNSKNNKRNNPKAAKKRKDANNRANRLIIQQQGLGHELLTVRQVNTKAKAFFKTKRFRCLENQTMEEALTTNSHSIYIGTTMLTLKLEGTRWLTRRGSQNQRGTRSGANTYTGQKNRPSLLHVDEQTITQTEAMTTLGGTMQIFHHSRLRLNETNIEDRLQQYIQKFPLGTRLHRFPAMGAKLAAKATEERQDPDFLCKTFMTSFPITDIHGGKLATDKKRKVNWVELSGKRVKVNR
jgi:hypothetical protein